MEPSLECFRRQASARTSSPKRMNLDVGRQGQSTSSGPKSANCVKRKGALITTPVLPAPVSAQNIKKHYAVYPG